MGETIRKKMENQLFSNIQYTKSVALLKQVILNAPLIFETMRFFIIS